MTILSFIIFLAPVAFLVSGCLVKEYYPFESRWRREKILDYMELTIKVSGFISFIYFTALGVLHALPFLF